MTKAERQKMLEEKLITMQAYENELRGKNITYIGGVDEVGRGPLAGKAAHRHRPPARHHRGHAQPDHCVRRRSAFPDKDD